MTEVLHSPEGAPAPDTTAAPQDALGTTEAGPAHMQPPAPVSPLTKHWEAAQEEFNTSGSDARRNRNIAQELLALGSIQHRPPPRRAANTNR